MTVSAGNLEAGWARKVRGAFFTPDALARFVVDWAVRTGSDRILEPSCGDAAFLVPAAERLHWLAGVAERSQSAGVLDAVEIDAESAVQAQGRIDLSGVPGRVQTADFFAVPATGSYSAVIGNPPYVRYQDFHGAARSRSREATAAAGVTLSGLASSWAAFVVHAAAFLAPGGRLGLVLPGELLSVGYAAEVRRFLYQRFARVDLVVFTERVSPTCRKKWSCCSQRGGARVQPTASACDRRPTWPIWPMGCRRGPGGLQILRRSGPVPCWGGIRWPRFDRLVGSSDVTTLQQWGETTLGMVTGNNGYFALSDQQVSAAGLEPGDLLRLSPPGSRHLRGLELSDEAMADLAQAGASTWLFRPPGQLGSAAAAYVASGQALGIPLAYKCRVRAPW